MRSYAELHVHIEGALEPEMVLELAKKNKVELPYKDVAQLKSKLTYESLQDYLDLYHGNMAVLVTEEDFAQATRAYLTKAKAAGVIHSEVSFELQDHLARGISAQTVMDGINSVLSKSEDEFGISTGLVLSVEQGSSPEDAQAAYTAAIEAGAEFDSVGICITKGDVDIAPLVPLFGKARADGLHTVANVIAGAGPELVWDCLHKLRVGRIGVCAVLDRSLMYYLADYSIPLTISPLANQALHSGGSSEITLPMLLDEGVVVSIVSGSPAYFGGYLDANLAAATQQFDLGESQLDILARNSIVGSFLSEAKKLELVGQPA